MQPAASRTAVACGCARPLPSPPPLEAGLRAVQGLRRQESLESARSALRFRLAPCLGSFHRKQTHLSHLLPDICRQSPPHHAPPCAPCVEIFPQGIARILPKSYSQVPSARRLPKGMRAASAESMQPKISTKVMKPETPSRHPRQPKKIFRLPQFSPCSRLPPAVS